MTKKLPTNANPIFLENASASEDGLMSAADKAKLDGIPAGGGGVTVTQTLNNGPIAMTGGPVLFCSTPAPSDGTYVVSVSMYYQPGSAGDGGFVGFKVNGAFQFDSNVSYNDAQFGGNLLPVAIHQKFTGVLSGQIIECVAVATAGSTMFNAVLHLMRIGP